MTIGMPIVALATTELPTVITNDVTGYISCNVEELIDGMRRLIADPAEARRLGDNARELARTRFGLERFAADWNAAFERALALPRAASVEPVVAEG
jgi:glycosyltransferase involved in cell wall biosynthesis